MRAAEVETVDAALTARRTSIAAVCKQLHLDKRRLSSRLSLPLTGYGDACRQNVVQWRSRETQRAFPDGDFAPCKLGFLLSTWIKNNPMISLGVEPTTFRLVA
jgi:hypothetical protein